MSWNASIGIPLAIAGAIILALIYFFGRPRRPNQGRRMPPAREPGARDGERVDPTFGDVPDQAELDGSSRPGETEPSFVRKIGSIPSVASNRARTFSGVIVHPALGW